MQSAEAVLDVIRERGSASPEWTTGEPCVGKLTSTVRGGADGKGPASWAPRRRPTPLLGHWLIWTRKREETRACQESGGRPEASTAVRRKTRVIWPKLNCLKPNLQR